MWALGLTDFLKPNKLKLYHFGVILILAIVCWYFGPNAYNRCNSGRDVPLSLLDYLMVSYLLLVTAFAVISTYVLRVLVYFALHLEIELFVPPFFIGIISLAGFWVLSCLFVDMRSKNASRSKLHASIIFIFIFSIGLALLYQIGLFC